MTSIVASIVRGAHRRALVLALLILTMVSSKASAGLIRYLRRPGDAASLA
jgi:hypothetical protein